MEIKTKAYPCARHEGIVVEELGDEILIYDTVNDRAHTLNSTAALVWKLCDGKRSVGEIALAAGNELQQPISEQIVMYALAKLAEYQLLEESVAMPSAVVSRREFLTKFAVAAAVVPVVKTLKVPTATDGASCLEQGSICTSKSPIKAAKGKQKKTNGPLLPCCSGLICCPGSGECSLPGDCLI